MKQLDVQRRFRMTFPDFCRLSLLLGALAVAVVYLPNNVYSSENHRIIFALGVLAIWRYTWWFTHFVRSQIYARYTFPRVRQQAEELWNSGWRPKRLLYMVTTFKEVRSTTELLMGSLVAEVRSTGIPAKIFFGTYDALDEQIVTTYLRKHADGLDITCIFVRQKVPGKRVSIGLALRAMSRYGVTNDDLVLFLDGDTYVEQGILRKCLPLFMLDPKLDGLTTDEESILHGPKWMQYWTDMRHAQRHLTMQSIALSGKILTLTGRCSFFRGRDVVEESFIRLVEADHLDHWLWGRFRFLSGDDKSTAYALFSKPGGTTLSYVPDAVATTIEYVDGDGFTRVRQNLLRWSGNLLRNGGRCIALGPDQMGWFPWWCIVDQRIAMWTTMIGPVMALWLTLMGGWSMLMVCLLTVICTRTLLAFFLWYYAGKIYVSWPFLLYFNQITNSAVKLYMIFRLAKQRWRNRGDQKSAENSGWLATFQNFMSSYLTNLYLVAFTFTLFVVFVMQKLPRWAVVEHVFGMR